MHPHRGERKKARPAGPSKTARRSVVKVRAARGSKSPANGKSSRSSFSPEVKAFLESAMRIRKLAAKKPLEQWHRYQESRPCLSGRDILDLGYKPGPLFTKIFDSLRQARWEGKLRTREEEIRFLTQTFPIHGR